MFGSLYEFFVKIVQLANKKYLIDLRYFDLSQSSGIAQ